MKRIHYASGTLLTGDAIADVLVKYAAALATNAAAAEVRAPAILESGERGEVVMLLGPASQILAESEHFEGDELRDDQFVRAIDEKVTALGPRRATFVRSGTEGMDDLDVDLL
ncbi:hypothetical protein [Leifsonia shinshuensis]|uniref:Uncharacterized protein n=1 Tax=Leifsonia shinshuensis TaxID=150026 RepID=A0A7G6YCV6_9MICO|nr:hypothetical protein [Leifsonia shinshuensis]QNE36321.1 hypothetical protein F1C12_15175 [Leifsonia shinshuensis]